MSKSKSRTMTKTAAEQTQKPYLVVVLGPHRSGTSALSGVLSHLGADLPATLMPATAANKTGYFESVRVMNFNEKLLNALGSDWQDVTPLDTAAISPQVHESLMAEATRVLQEEFAAARLPILKDPRVCRLVDFWSEAILRAGYEPLYVHMHRNPIEVASSLRDRDRIPIETGMLIWLRHVLDAEKATRGRRRAFTSYQGLMTDWPAQVARIERDLGLTFHRKGARVALEIDAFASEEYRHHQSTSADVQKFPQAAGIVRDTFRVLETWAGGTATPADLDRLDEVRRRFDAAVDTIGTFIRAQASDSRAQDALAALAERNAQAQQAALDALYADLHRLGEQDGAHLARISELEAALRQRGLEAEEWFAEKTRQAAEIEAMQAAMQEKADLLRALETRLASQQKDLQEKFAGQERENQRLTETARGLEAKLAARFKEISKISEMLLLSQAEKEKETRARAENAARVDALLASTSWKITAPLRRMVMMVRRSG